MRMTTIGGTHISADSMLLASVRVARPKNPCSGGETDRSLTTYCAPLSEILLRGWTNADNHTRTAATITETASIEVVCAKGSWPGIVDTPYDFSSLPTPSREELPVTPWTEWTSWCADASQKGHKRTSCSER